MINMLGGLFKWCTIASLFSCAAADSAPLARPALNKLQHLRGGAAEQTKTGKVWVTSSFTRDHVRLAWELPGYLGAYVNPFSAIEPKTIESVMLTINSINTCPYCTGLHGELARMAAVDKMAGPAVDFAKVFATESGRGAAVQDAFAKVRSIEAHGTLLLLTDCCFISPHVALSLFSLTLPAHPARDSLALAARRRRGHRPRQEHPRLVLGPPLGQDHRKFHQRSPWQDPLGPPVEAHSI